MSEIRREFLRIAEELRAGDNEYQGRRIFDELYGVLQRPRRLFDDLQARNRLAIEHLRFNEFEPAIQHVETVLRVLQERSSKPTSLLGAYRVRGLVYLRQAEILNCVERHNAECCILPLSGGGVHTERRPAELAAESYLRYLEIEPTDLKIRWMLNLAHMALGDYPDAVPERFRVPLTAANAADFPRFRDVAAEVGLERLNLAGGIVVEDMNQDGRLDVVVSSSDPFQPLGYFRGVDGGKFEPVTQGSGLEDQLGGLNILHGDYDNDGWIDLLVMRGAWLFDHGRIRKSLLRNNGDGTFTDVTHAVGLGAAVHPSQTAAWLDFDNDGDLDLFIGNESRVGDPSISGAPGQTTPGDYPSQLFRNDGGKFVDVARAAGVTNDRYCKGVAIGDYDNDGDVDIYVANIGPNRLYRNEGDGHFVDVAPELGVTEPSGRTFAPWFFDYNNDGRLDLWVSAYDAKLDDIVRDRLGEPMQCSPPALYRNNPDGTFTNATAELGLSHPYLPMGANFGDFDNDGWLDIYLGTGDPDFQTLIPNVALRNDAGRRFLDITQASGLGHLQKGHGVGFADFDGDGDQDIFHQLGGFYPADRFHNALFLNPGNENAWIALKLVGTKSNRLAYGARVRLTLDTPEGPREIHRAVGSVSSFGGSPSRLEVGLGAATVVRELRVDWPVSGKSQLFRDVAARSAYRLVEGVDRLEPLP